MTIDIDNLETLARAASKGPWNIREQGPEDFFVEAPGSPDMPYRLDVCGDDYVGHGDDEQRRRNWDFIATADPDAILALVARLRDAEGNHAASCIYCGEAVIYDTRKVDDMEAAHQLLIEHDRQCPKNPVAQEVGALKAHCRELRLALFNAGAGAAGVAERLSGEDEVGPDPDSALLQPLMDIHDAAAEALRGYPAMSLAREKIGGQEPDARGKAAVLLELARDYRDMGVDADVIENLRARAGMELATVGIAIQEFEESQS